MQVAQYAGRMLLIQLDQLYFWLGMGAVILLQVALLLLAVRLGYRLGLKHAPQKSEAQRNALLLKVDQLQKDIEVYQSIKSASIVRNHTARGILDDGIRRLRRDVNSAVDTAVWMERELFNLNGEDEK